MSLKIRPREVSLAFFLGIGMIYHLLGVVSLAAFLLFLSFIFSIIHPIPVSWSAGNLLSPDFISFVLLYCVYFFLIRRFIIQFFKPITFLISIPAVIGISFITFGITVTTQSKSWPYVGGTITESVVERNSKGYFPKVEYKYITNGIIYSGNQVSNLQWVSSDSSRSEEIVNRYKFGQDVKVYYKPSDPQTSVLENATDLLALAIFSFIGLVLIAFTVICLVMRRYMHTLKWTERLNTIFKTLLER